MGDNSIGGIERVENPERTFAYDSPDFERIVEVVRAAFGTKMEREDIHNHVAFPEKVYVARETGGDIVAMGAYTPKVIHGEPLLYIEGFVVHPHFQQGGIFADVTSLALESEKLIGLRTQSPRMHRALENLCGATCPNANHAYSDFLAKIRDGLTHNLEMGADEYGVSRGFYGKSLYPEEQFHSISGELFNGLLGVNYDAGDSIVCVGARK